MHSDKGADSRLKIAFSEPRFIDALRILMVFVALCVGGVAQIEAGLALGLLGLLALVPWVERVLPMHAQRSIWLSFYRSLRSSSEGRLAEVVEFPREQNLTIMFIDMVGFSLTVESQRPSEAFSHLRQYLGWISEIVKRHGGRVDRSTGDGLLCFFGFDEPVATQDVNHAEQALMCAFEIQHTAVNRIVAGHRDGSPLYPLRIGINSGLVFVGNLGDQDRPDTTVIGNSVNLASRLETACEPFLIMLGPKTREMVLDHDIVSGALRQRLFKTKHHTDLLDAFEFNPFFECPEQLDLAKKCYWEFAGYHRVETRMLVAKPLDMVTENGSFEVKDFSPSGFRAVGGTYLARGVVVHAALVAPDHGFLAERLRDAGLESISLEVRWGSPMGARFMHGFRIVGLNNEQKDRLFRICCETVDPTPDGLIAAGKTCLFF